MQEFHKNMGPKNKWVNWSLCVIREEEKGVEVKTAEERRAIYRKMNKSKHLVKKCLLGHKETTRQRGLWSSSLANLPADYHTWLVLHGIYGNRFSWNRPFI